MNESAESESVQKETFIKQEFDKQIALIQAEIENAKVLVKQKEDKYARGKAKKKQVQAQFIGLQQQKEFDDLEFTKIMEQRMQ